MYGHESVLKWYVCRSLNAPSRVFLQSSITMATVLRVATTLQMSSTSVWTAGCALMTRRWRSSISTRWSSRLQSALPTCCTTVAWTCCRNHTPTTRTHARTHTCMQTHTYNHTHTHVSPQEHCPTSPLSFLHRSCYSREPAFPTSLFILFVCLFGEEVNTRDVSKDLFSLHARPRTGAERLGGRKLALEGTSLDAPESLLMSTASCLTG